MYQVKNKTFKSYNAAVNHALIKGTAITDVRGNVIPTLRVTDKVTYFGEALEVIDINRSGVVLGGSGNYMTIEGKGLRDIRKPGEAQQPRRQAQRPQPQQFTINF